VNRGAEEGTGGALTAGVAEAPGLLDGHQGQPGEARTAALDVRTAYQLQPRKAAGVGDDLIAQAADPPVHPAGQAAVVRFVERGQSGAALRVSSVAGMIEAEVGGDEGGWFTAAGAVLDVGGH
jgi:hypothetical protein